MANLPGSKLPLSNAGADSQETLSVMAVETGMRKSELLAMQWQRVDFDKKTLLIPETKNGHPRRLPSQSQSVTEFSPDTGSLISSPFGP